jgi:hypothetical protein
MRYLARCAIDLSTTGPLRALLALLLRGRTLSEGVEPCAAGCLSVLVELCRLCIGWTWIRLILFLPLVAHLHVPVLLRALDHSIRKLSFFLARSSCSSHM